MALTKITSDVIGTGAVTSDHLASGAVTHSSLSSITTDNVSEGSTNTYFTNARARGSVSVTGGGLSYDSGTGVIQIGSIPNASLTNSSLTVNSNSVSLGGSVTLDTDDIGEGSTNLYFTNARAQGAISGGTGVTVSSGTISIGQDVATSSTPTFGNITTTGYIAGPATFTIDPAAVGDNTGTVVIAGNLQVDGTTTTINSTTLEVDDLNITLASGAANAAAANGAGITVDGASATITYDGTNDEWDFNKDINVTGTISSSAITSSGLLTLNDNYAMINAGTTSNTTLEPVIWARSQIGASVVQMNVQGDEWQFGGGGTLDTTPILKLKYGTNAATFAGTISSGAITSTGNITLAEYLYHNGNTGTNLRFQTDRASLTSGGGAIVDAHSNGNLYLTGTTVQVYGNYNSSGTINSGAITSSAGITANGPFKSGGSNNYILFDYDGDFTGGNYYAIQDTSANRLRISYGFSATDNLELDSSGNFYVNGGNATFAGTISSGAITSSGLVTSVGGVINTNTGSNPLYITRLGNANESLKIYTDDASVWFESIQDESADDYGNFIFVMDGGTTEPFFDVRKGTAASGSKFRVDGGGKVGIGTDSPSAKLEIKGASSTNYLQFNNSSDSELFRIDSNFNWAWGTTSPSQAFDMRNNSGNALFAVDRSNGRVGIGTTSPAEKLDVNGKGCFTKSYSYASTNYHIKLKSSYGDGISSYISNISSANRIDISAGGYYYGAALYQLTDGATGMGTINIGQDGTLTYQSITGATANNTINPVERFRIDSSGNVGIGEITPDDTLHVNSSGGTAKIRIGSGNDAYYTRKGYLGDEWVFGTGETSDNVDFKISGGAFTAANAGGNFRFFTQMSNGTPAERMRITSSGDITMSGTGSLKVPSGTTAQRPSSPTAGMMRYNSSNSELEVYTTMWTPIKTEAPLEFQQASTYNQKWTIAADGQSAQAGSGYSAISVNLNFEGNFILITKWSHDYMGVGIGYKAGITNANFTGESADAAGPYGGGSNVDGFDSTVSYMGQYHWPSPSGGANTNLTTYYIKHQRVGNTISTHYSTNSASATDPSHSSWTQVQSATISSTDHCKPLWGEASSQESVPLTILYNDITGGYNAS